MEKTDLQRVLDSAPEGVKAALFNQGIHLYMSKLVEAQEVLEKSLHLRPPEEREAILEVINGSLAEAQVVLFNCLRSMTPELGRVFGDIERKWIEFRDRKKKEGSSV